MPSGRRRAPGFLPALRGEVYLALRSRGARAALLLPMAMAAGRVALGRIQGAAREVRQAARGASGGGGLETNAYGPFVDGISAGLVLAALLLLALAASSIASDRELGTARLPLTRRASRGALLLAKLATLCLLAVLVLGGVAAASWASSALLYDFGPVVEDGYEIFSASEVRREAALGLGLAALPLLATLALGLAISAAARSPAGAVSAALLLALSFDVLKGLLGDGAAWVFLSFQPTLLDHSYLKEVSKLARGFSDAGHPDLWRRLNWTVPLPQAALLLAVAWWLVERRKM